MSFSYTKLFSSITESTVWSEPLAVRVVWVTMLAMVDRYGRVWGSVPGLARRANVTLEECQQALSCFLSPDSHSRTPDHAGRRIEPIDGGWRLLNYDKYREMQDEEAQRERNAERQRRFRERHKAEVPHETVTGSNATVTEVTKNNPIASAAVDATAVNQKKNRPTAAAPPAAFAAAWSAYPKRDGDNPKSAALRSWRARLAEGHTAAEMQAGVDRYAAWCQVTGKVGTETVMQAKRFFGPDKPFLNAWSAPGGKTPPRTFSASELEQ